jgi:hypothetical protein
VQRGQVDPVSARRACRKVFIDGEALTLKRAKLFLMFRHTFVDIGKGFNDRTGGLLKVNMQSFYGYCGVRF